jgi:hypothetical protein
VTVAAVAVLPHGPVVVESLREAAVAVEEPLHGASLKPGLS